MSQVTPVQTSSSLPSRASWQGSVPLGVAAVLVTVLADRFNLRDPGLVLQLAGLLLLGLGGFVGSIAYRSFSRAISTHAVDLEAVRIELISRERAFRAGKAGALSGKPPGFS